MTGRFVITVHITELYHSCTPQISPASSRSVDVSAWKSASPIRPTTRQTQSSVVMFRTFRPLDEHHESPTPGSPHIPRRSSRRDGTTTIITDSNNNVSPSRSRSPSSSPSLYRTFSGRNSIAASMSVPNFSRVLATSTSRDAPPVMPHTPSRKSSGKASAVKRWNGHTRTFSDWDCLRRVSRPLISSQGGLLHSLFTALTIIL